MTFYIDANKTGAAREISSLLKTASFTTEKTGRSLYFCVSAQTASPETALVPM